MVYELPTHVCCEQQELMCCTSCPRRCAVNNTSTDVVRRTCIYAVRSTSADTLDELIVVWRALIRHDGSRGNEEKSPIHVDDVVRMMGESQIITGDLGARADDEGFDDAVETDDSDNGPVDVGRLVSLMVLIIRRDIK